MFIFISIQGLCDVVALNNRFFLQWNFEGGRGKRLESVASGGSFPFGTNQDDIKVAVDAAIIRESSEEKL